MATIYLTECIAKTCHSDLTCTYTDFNVLQCNCTNVIGYEYVNVIITFPQLI